MDLGNEVQWAEHERRGRTDLTFLNVVRADPFVIDADRGEAPNYTRS